MNHPDHATLNVVCLFKSCNVGMKLIQIECFIRSLAAGRATEKKAARLLFLEVLFDDHDGKV